MYSPIEVLYVDLLVTGQVILCFVACHHDLISVHNQINHTFGYIHTSWCYRPRGDMVKFKILLLVTTVTLMSMQCIIAQIPIHVHPPGGSTELVVTNRMCFVGSHKSSPGSI